jgi:anion-transporting  ArsA/GET3 family ATPase
VAFVLVTSPDPLAVREAVFFADKLTEHGMRQAATVINRVTPLLAEPHGSEQEVRATLAPRVPNVMSATALEEKLWRALDDERMRAVTDRGEVERLRALTQNSGLYVEVPTFEEDVHDLRALARVAEHLMGVAA